MRPHSRTLRGRHVQRQLQDDQGGHLRHPYHPHRFPEGRAHRRRRLRPASERASGPTRLAVNVTNHGSGCRTTVHSSDTVTGGEGLTNITVTPSSS